MASGTKILGGLHLGCAAVAFLFASISIFISRGQVKRYNAKGFRRQHYLYTTSISLVVVAYIVEFIILATRSHALAHQEAEICHLVLLPFLWIITLVRRQGYRQLVWGTALITLLFEVPILILSPFWGWREIQPPSQFTCRAIRAFILLGFVVGAIYDYTMRSSSISDGGEIQPFLYDQSADCEPGCTTYGTESLLRRTASETDAEDGSDGTNEIYYSDSEDDSASMKKRRAKRLKETGGWWGYLKDFSIFIPFLIPKKDRKVQFCIFLNLLCIAGNRTLYILRPRQLGIVTDLLLARQAPYKAFAIWLLLSLFSNEGAISLAEELAKIPIKQFSYRQITNAAFNHVMCLPLEFHSERDSAEVMKAIEQGEALSNLLDTAINEILPVLIDLTIAFGLLYWKFNTYVALTMAVAAAVFVAFEVTGSNWNLKNRRESTKAKREEARVMHQAVQGWQTVTYFNMFGFEKRRFGQTVDAQLSATWKWAKLDAYLQAVLDIMVPITFFILGTLVLHEILEGGASPGDWVFLIQYWENLIWPLKWLSHDYRSLSADLVDAERLLDLLQTKSNIVDKEGAINLDQVKGHVAFENVTFSYDPRVKAIQDLNISVIPGQTVAFVGETGAGKSTIIKLLLRFYDVNGGRITIDGHDIRDITLSSLREALGVVPQDPLLFNASILENLRYARPSATEAEIFDACRAAAIHDKIIALPDGYESQVGEQGVKLSGGEIQRLAIARVFLKNPPILILDEATSAVDTVTESNIQAALDVLKQGRSTFMIAHRLSTLASANRILVVHGGEIVESGTHSELLSQDGRYKDLWTRQTGNFAEDQKRSVL
ncbi:Fc.00g005420.m01.CDS01 [Cosmosporella sp. VM-42]